MDTMRVGPQDLMERMAGGQLYRVAYERGMNLSGLLDEEMPSDEYKDGLDGYERMLKVAGIKTRSSLHGGWYADKFEAFDKDDNTRALVPEFVARQYRKVAYGAPEHGAGTRAGQSFLSDDDAVGSIFRPYTDSPTPRIQRLAPAIPLASIVAITTPIDTDAYRAYYLTDVAADQRFVRVGESAPFPKVRVSGGQKTINVFKYGRALEISYETLRRQRIDKVAFWIQRLAIRAETDKVATALDVLINGDGNANTAATNYNLTALDGAAVAGTLTTKGWFSYKLKFSNPYSLDTIITQEAGGLQVLMLNVGTANWSLVQLQGSLGTGGLTPINPELSRDVRYGITADAPALTLVGFDSRLALERVVEIGADITEVERYASRQTNEIVMSEVEGYAVFDQFATKTLNINA